MNDDEIQFRNIDPDDIDDVIKNIEKSFGFKFMQKDLDGVNNFGQFCAAVLFKINLPHADGCSSQQAFYKLRDSISHVTGINKNNITPSSNLEDIFPKERRREKIKQIESIVGVSLKVLQPKRWVTNFFTTTISVAFISIFFNWPFGLLAFVAAIICDRIASHYGRELKFATIRQVAGYFACYHYKAARRNPNTINRFDAEKNIKDLFIHGLHILPSTALTRDATFN